MSHFSLPAPSRARRERGFGLVESMVVIVIILFMSLTIFTVMAASEGHKRTTTSVSDADQEGSYAVYTLDKAIRSAGSGFRAAQDYSYGCPVSAALSGAAILPVSSAANLPPMFQQVDTDLGGVYRMAPVLIDKNASLVSGRPASDALIVMSGTSGYGEFPTTFQEPPTIAGASALLNLTGTTAFNPNDLVLIVQPPATNGLMLPCAISQVAGTGTWPVDAKGIPTQALTNPQLPLAGTYFSAGSPGLTFSLSTLTQTAQVMDLGNALTDGHPQFQLFAVAQSATGNTSINNSLNSSLWSYDLLFGGATGGTPQGVSVADSVYEMHALYGVSSAATCATTNIPPGCPITSWEDPASANWSLNVLTNGTTTANAALYRIKAIRLGIIMRAALPEQKTSATSTPVQLTTVTLFNNLLPAGGSAAPYTRTFNLAGETSYRYRTIEVTIPVRNNLF